MQGVNKQLVAKGHAAGLFVYVYTVNNIADIQKMYNLGVDAIFSNYPDRVKKL